MRCEPPSFKTSECAEQQKKSRGVGDDYKSRPYGRKETCQFSRELPMGQSPKTEGGSDIRH